jgi:hypothetical protein
MHPAVLLLAALALSALPTPNASPHPSGVPVLGGNHAVPAIRSNPPNTPPEFTLQYEQRFSSPKALHDFVMSDPEAWTLLTGTPHGSLELSKQSQYEAPVRSPANIALIADRQFGDFILECDLLQTGKDYPHRDLCLFFGFQNPTNFYYVHLASAADDHAHNIFLVHNAPRTRIARETSPGVHWGLNTWHRIRLERQTASGLVKVWFDDLESPIMIAEDKTLTTGAIGVGSFDDTGRIANIRVWAPTMERQPTPFFRPAPNPAP